MKKLVLATRNTVRSLPTETEQKLCPKTEVTPVAYRLCCHAGTDHQCVYRKFQVVLFKKPFP